MNFEIEVVPTEKLVRGAHLYVTCQPSRSPAGGFKDGFAAFAVAGGICLLIGFWAGRTWVYVGGGIVGFGLALTLSFLWSDRAKYRQRVKASLERIRRRTNPGVRYQFLEDGVHFEDELGFSFIQWRSLRKFSQFDEGWLLYLDDIHYLVFPIDRLSTEALKFITEKCKECGLPVKTEWSKD